MKKVSLLWCFFVSVFALAQTIKGTIVSSEDQKPIPYAKIGVLTENFGTQADENGQFQMNFDEVPKDKNLVIMVGGFEKFEVKVSDFIKKNPHSVFLKPKESKIDEVIIKTSTYKEKNMGITTKTKSVMFTPNMEKGNAVVEETAIEFSSKKRLKILKINMNFSRFEATTPINVRYTIYDVKDGQPNDLILEKDIIAEIKPSDIVDQTYSLDVSKENIWLEGKFFVGIQFIGEADRKVALSGALLKSGFYRSFFGEWKKIGLAAPAINIDVKVKK